MDHNHSHTHHDTFYQPDAHAARGHWHDSDKDDHSHGSKTYRIFCKTDPNFSLAVKYNNVLVLTPSDAREDEQVTFFYPT